MTREEEIVNAAMNCKDLGETKYHSFARGALWADEHPISGEQIAAMKNEIEFLKRKLVECDKMYRELQNDNLWQGVKEELPKVGEEVYIKTQLGFNYIGYLKKRTMLPFKKKFIWYLKNNGYASIINPVTHWMPIPETQKECEK